MTAVPLNSAAAALYHLLQRLGLARTS